MLSLGRCYRSALDRLDTLDERWISMADDALGKRDMAAAAHAVQQDSERLFLAIFHRRTETVADVAVMGARAFVLLDREQEAPGRAVALVLRALADIATTATKATGLDFSMIGPLDLSARLRACLAFRLNAGVS